MVDIKTIDSLVISQFASCLREFFLMKDFYEVALFDTTKYIVTNTKQIKTKTGEYLRNTTEPEIWQLGIDYDRFFCITSLFRNEDVSSLLHKNEFKIVDFYQKNSNENEMLKTLFEALEFLEERFCLPKLSGLQIKVYDFDDFINLNTITKDTSIFKVENYPLEESFYDVVDDKTGKSKKGELFFVCNESPIEFSVYGQVDKNKNPLNKIKNFNFDSNIKSLNLFGMCLGIERIILCYQTLKELQNGINNKKI